MSEHLFGTKFDTLGHIADEILVILYVHPFIFLRFSLFSKVFINIYEYVF